MKITMTPQAAETLFEDFDHDEIQVIREGFGEICKCESCKGDIDFWDSEGWVKNVATIKESVVAEINESNQSRMDAEVTLDEAQALRIVANLVKFLF